MKEKQISKDVASAENIIRHAYNQGYEQGLKDSKQEPCEQIKWERDTAIKQLNELGYGLGEKIKDCISRKALLDAIYQKEYGTDYYDGNMLNIPYIDLIKSLPSVNPAERVGRWIELKDGYDDEYYECTICGTPLDTIVGTPDDNGFNFCPFCGCRMKGEGEE